MAVRRVHVAAAQSAVFLASGLWPIFHLKSFEAVTGPKLEGWLVKTVGLLIASVGAGLAIAAAKRHVSDEAAAIGALSATALAGIDLRYGLSGRIAKMYLADSILESAFVLAWLWTARQPKRTQDGDSHEAGYPLGAAV